MKKVCKKVCNPVLNEQTCVQPIDYDVREAVELQLHVNEATHNHQY